MKFIQLTQNQMTNSMKPRNRTLLFYMGQPVAVTQLQTSPTGEITLCSNDGLPIKPVGTYEQNLYQRDSGKDKILNQIKIDQAKLGYSKIQFEKYDLIVAADTNTPTKLFKEGKLSVCCAFFSGDKEFSPNGEIKITGEMYTIPMWNLPDKNEEKCALVEVIKSIKIAPNIAPSKNIALITDHDLGNIAKYNNRELPIFNDFFLPKNFTLIYASADVGKENILNVLISKCDNEAKKFIKEMEKQRQYIALI